MQGRCLTERDVRSVLMVLLLVLLLVLVRLVVVSGVDGRVVPCWCRASLQRSQHRVRQCCEAGVHGR